MGSVQQPWSPEEIETLLRRRAICNSVREVWSGMTGRTESAVAKKLHQLGQSYARVVKPWTSDLAEHLRHLWNTEAKSANECADILGMTRNAVIGKAHRMKLAERASPIKRKSNVIEVDFRGCEYPHGEPRTKGFHFCGAERQHGSSYCPQHHRLCYRRVMPQKHKPTREDLVKRGWDFVAKSLKPAGGTISHREDFDADAPNVSTADKLFGRAIG